MPRKSLKPEAGSFKVLECVQKQCLSCGKLMWNKSDGQQSIRKAVEVALPEIAHGLCHFHYLKEAVKVIYEAHRHAKKELISFPFKFATDD